MGLSSSLDVDSDNSKHKTEVVDSAKWTASTYQDETSTECDECEAGLVSPLLKASQESAGRAVDHLRCLTESDSTIESDTNTHSDDNTIRLLRQMRQRDEHQDSEALSHCSYKKQRLHDSDQKDGDPFYTFPLSAGTSPTKLGLGEQLVDAASILLSIGQAKGFQTAPHHPGLQQSWTAVKREYQDEEEDENAHEEDYLPSECTTSPSPSCHDQHEHSPRYAGDTRIFPTNIPIDLEEFPRLYQRYKVPSSITESQRMAVFGSLDPAFVKDKELRAIASRGMKEWGSWNEPTNALDLYTPRWVRGSLKDKLGLCTICYEEEPGKMVWKRTKTSEYNYHLINAHGISPQTHRPYDPPIAYNIREQTSTSAGHRKEVIQGKCHACKKYIDMQGKYIGKVKIPEIYWWKHARKCHKGRKSFPGTGGVFVEDKVSTVLRV
jgi:hypothetical protein